MRRKMLILVISLGLFHAAFGVSTKGAETIGRGVVSGKNVNLRLQPTLSAAKVSVLRIGTSATILKESNDWYKVRLDNGTEGWVYNRYLAKNYSMESSRGNFLWIFEMVSFAKRFLGLRYVYGGATPTGFDCSGFTMYIYKQFGFLLPHNAAAQMQTGVEVEKQELLPGDLLFFRTTGAGKVSHVGIYLGAGEFIHASSEYRAIKIAWLDGVYYKKRYVGARRIFAAPMNNLPVDEINEKNEDHG